MSEHGTWSGIGRSDPLSKRDLEELGIKRNWWQKTLYQFKQDSEDPLTYHAADGYYYRPNNGLVHDYGSIPKIAQIIPAFSKDRYADSYILHDAAYNHTHTILRSSNGTDFEPVTVDRKFSDELLRESILAQDALPITANTIYAAVRLAGWISWKYCDELPCKL